MSQDFYMDNTQLRRLQKTFKQSPKLLRPVTANVINSLAFDAKKQYFREIDRNMIVRNRRFVESSLQVQKARSGPIEKQIALSGSVNRPRFTGWQEQQEGRPSKTKRAITTAGRGGNKRNISKTKARLRSGNKFYKPEQFSGRDLKGRFMFMMRVLNTRGGGEFIISSGIPTRRGTLKPGLYSLRKHRITRFQTFNVDKSKRITWMTNANKALKFSTDLTKKYEDGLKRVLAKSMPRRK
jgi:hypothetical protein